MQQRSSYAQSVWQKRFGFNSVFRLQNLPCDEPLLERFLSANALRCNAGHHMRCSMARETSSQARGLATSEKIIGQEEGDHGRTTRIATHRLPWLQVQIITLQDRQTSGVRLHATTAVHMPTHNQVADADTDTDGHDEAVQLG